MLSLKRVSRRDSSRSSSARSRASSLGPGGRTAAERMAPRRRKISLRTASPNPGCCSWRTSGKYTSNNRLVAAAGRKQRGYGHQHLRIGKTGHDAVGAAGELLRHIQSAIADKDADISPRDAVAGFAYLRELLQAGAVLVLEHHHARMRVDDLEEALSGDVGLRRLRIVLVDD